MGLLARSAVMGGLLLCAPRSPRGGRGPLAKLTARTDLLDESSRRSLSYRVREALLDEEEKPYIVWRSDKPRPIGINLDMLNYRARTLMKRGDLDGSIATYKHCTELDPEDGRAWLAISRWHEKQRRFREAEEALEAGVEYNPESAHLLQASGALSQRRGRSDDALQAYTKALRVNPLHSPAWVACALLLERRGQEEAAWRCLCLAKSAAPRSYYVWQVVGQWHRRRGEK